jgi:tetratricopeptide (TPR) repeat protein
MADSPRLIALRRRVQSDPASTAFAQLADECCRLGRFEEAAACCRSGLAHHPSYLSAHVILGRALTELGQFDEAAAEFEFVLSSAPDNLTAKRGLAELHERRSGQSNGNEFDGMLTQLGKPDLSAPPQIEKLLSNPPTVEASATVEPEPPAAFPASASVSAPSVIDAGELRPALAALRQAQDGPEHNRGTEAAAMTVAAEADETSPVAAVPAASSAVAVAEDPLATLETELRAFEEAHRPPPPDPAAEALAELEAWLVALRSPRSSRGAAPGG